MSSPKKTQLLISDSDSTKYCTSGNITERLIEFYSLTYDWFSALDHDDQTAKELRSNSRITNTVQRMEMFTKKVKFLPSLSAFASLRISRRAGSSAGVLAGDAFLWEASERRWSLFPAPACFPLAATHKTEQRRICPGAAAQDCQR